MSEHSECINEDSQFCNISSAIVDRKGNYIKARIVGSDNWTPFILFENQEKNREIQSIVDEAVTYWCSTGCNNRYISVPKFVLQTT